MPSSAVDEVFKIIFDHYNEPHRHYHSLNHLHYCLSVFARPQIAELAPNPIRVQLSLIGHDLVYQPDSSFNEPKSSQMSFGLYRSRLGLSTILVRSIQKDIEATVHLRVFDDPNTKLVLDIDLASLAELPGKFDHLGQLIRQEYGQVPEEQYRFSRIEILERFLNRERIYQTDYFHLFFEAQTRANLSRAIAQLRGSV